MTSRAKPVADYFVRGGPAMHSRAAAPPPMRLIVRRLAKAMPYYIDRPVEFVQEIIGAEPDVWQTAVLRSLVTHQKTGVASCTGAGKTALAAWAILWYLMTRPYCKVPVTAPGAPLLNAVLWAELAKWIRHSMILSRYLHWTKTRVNHRAAPNEWFAIARTTTARYSPNSGVKQSEGLAGFHGDFLFFVIDESSGVDDVHFQAAEGTLTGKGENKLLCIGNPLRVEGRFFDIFQKPTIAKYWAWYYVAGLESPENSRSYDGQTYVSNNVNVEYFHQLIEEFGEGSVMVEARVFGRFPINASVNTSYTLEEVRQAFLRWEDEDGPKVVLDQFKIPGTDKTVDAFFDEDHELAEVDIGVDCARMGDDEFVADVRIGYREVEKVIRPHSKANEMIGILCELFEKYPDYARLAHGSAALHPRTGKPLPNCKIDNADGGGGGSIADLLEAQGFDNVMRVDFGGTPNDSVRFLNVAAEMWLHELKRWMPYLALIYDEKLQHQLVSRTYEFTGEGAQRRIESKKAMKKRGLGSPDRADAACLMTLTLEPPGVA
jgi:phage terminase large subunit